MKLNTRRMLGGVCAGAVLAGIGLFGVATSANAQSASIPADAAILASTPTVFDLDGTYTDGGSARPVISDVNDVLTVDMSSQHRPTATGLVITGAVPSRTIVVTFPDAGSFQGTLVAPGTINWNNGSQWQKLPTVPDVVGLTVSTATSVLQSSGFAVARGGTDSTCNVRAGNVSSTSPGAGAAAVPGSTVTIRTAVKPRICP
jgi:hypothetical protein